MWVSSLSEMREIDLFHSKKTSFFALRQLVSLPVQLINLVAHPVGGACRPRVHQSGLLRRHDP
jgi:hypothetical protein